MGTLTFFTGLGHATSIYELGVFAGREEDVAVQLWPPR